MRWRFAAKKAGEEAYKKFGLSIPTNHPTKAIITGLVYFYAGETSYITFADAVGDYEVISVPDLMELASFYDLPRYNFSDIGSDTQGTAQITTDEFRISAVPDKMAEKYVAPREASQIVAKLEKAKGCTNETATKEITSILERYASTLAIPKDLTFEIKEGVVIFEGVVEIPFSNLADVIVKYV